MLAARLDGVDAELERERGLHRRELRRKAKEAQEVGAQEDDTIQRAQTGETSPPPSHPHLATPWLCCSLQSTAGMDDIAPVCLGWPSVRASGHTRRRSRPCEFHFGTARFRGTRVCSAVTVPLLSSQRYRSSTVLVFDLRCSSGAEKGPSAHDRDSCFACSDPPPAVREQPHQPLRRVLSSTQLLHHCCRCTAHLVCPDPLKRQITRRTRHHECTFVEGGGVVWRPCWQCGGESETERCSPEGANRLFQRVQPLWELSTVSSFRKCQQLRSQLHTSVSVSAVSRFFRVFFDVFGRTNVHLAFCFERMNVSISTVLNTFRPFSDHLRAQSDMLAPLPRALSSRRSIEQS